MAVNLSFDGADWNLDDTAKKGILLLLNAASGSSFFYEASVGTNPRTLVENLRFPGGGGIKFPATQLASADANALDDYEEGFGSAWTPVIGGDGGESGQTYATQVGTYLKVGRLVIATFGWEFSAKGTITGNLALKGLPFTAYNPAGTQRPVGHLHWSSWASSFVNLSLDVEENSTRAYFRGATAATQTPSVLSTANVDDNSGGFGSIIYLASA